MKGFRCWAPGPVLQLCQSASNTAASDKSQHAHVAPQGRRRPERCSSPELAGAPQRCSSAPAPSSDDESWPHKLCKGVERRHRLMTTSPTASITESRIAQ